MTIQPPYLTTVKFAGFGISSALLTPNTVTITQQEFSHDTAVMQFWGGDVDADALKSGTPMIMTFGRPVFQRTFYGYVNHAERMSRTLQSVASLTDKNATTVTCVGPSWPMKQVDSRVWFGATASQVVADIASSFSLAADIIPDGTVWNSLQMAGQTYWQFCVALAQKIGYTFYANGAQLVFKPRNTNPNDLTALAAVYDYSNDPAGLPIFSPVVGANSPSGGQLANRTLVGINPRTTQVVYSTVSGDPAPTILGSVPGTPTFNKTEHFTVESQQEADTKTMGVGALNQLYMTAQAYANGNAKVAQGQHVFVRNANGSQNGLWFVQQAAHTLDAKTYSMNLSLGRDSMGATNSLGFSPSMQSPLNAALIGNTWVAA